MYFPLDSIPSLLDRFDLCASVLLSIRVVEFLVSVSTTVPLSRTWVEPTEFSLPPTHADQPRKWDRELVHRANNINRRDFMDGTMTMLSIDHSDTA